MRILKNLLIIVVAMIGIISIIASGAPDENEDGDDYGHGNGECYVHVTATGTKYHSRDCHYLRYSDRVISKERAIREGYSPCLICGGRCDGTWSPCIATVEDKGGLPYVDITFEKNCPAAEWFYWGRFVKIDLPPATLTISLRIYPYHVRYRGSSCSSWTPYRRLGLYFEAECDGCDELVEWYEGSQPYSELRFPFRFSICFEPIGSGLVVKDESMTTLCEEFPDYPCTNDETGFVSGWVFFPQRYLDDHYNYSDIDELRFSGYLRSSANSFSHSIEMFELR